MFRVRVGSHRRFSSPESAHCLLVLAVIAAVTPYRRRAFSVAGPTVWNSLPDKLRDPSLSIDSFRRQLKTFLFAN